ncbi:MAG: Recombinase [Parcubacteria group bacterium GW2011_GWC2_45_15]|nr:MAG: Recombinase [Parcubacteria group bacterium GW2011_GWC2_45_15]
MVAPRSKLRGNLIEYITENNLAKQVDKIISKVALSYDWASKMLNQVKLWGNQENQSSALALTVLQAELDKLELRLSKLLDAHLEGILEASEYQNKKAELIEKKASLKQKIARAGRKGNQWLEPLKKWINEANMAQKTLLEGNFEAKAELLKKIGSNRLIKAGKALILLTNPQKILAERPRPSGWQGW